MQEKFHRAEKLMMRIRSLKWNAATMTVSSHDADVRREAAAIRAEFETLESTARGETTEDAMRTAEQRVDVLATRLAALGPQ
jgi:hypothetical protein